MPDDDASYDGSLNAVKGLLFSCLCILWAGICLKYYLKIRAQLKAGAASSGSKAIKKVSGRASLAPPAPRQRPPPRGRASLAPPTLWKGCRN